MTHSITPPPELVQEWWEQADQYQDDPKTYFDYVATEAAQWGADTELEACCELAPGIANYFRERRRPKPPSLKEQALDELTAWAEERNGPGESLLCDGLSVAIIRRALEALPDD